MPQRITVPSNGQRVTLALGTQQAAAHLLTRTAPGVEEAAYLVAEIAPPPGVWPPGAVGLYRDGAFVGTGRLDFNASTASTPGAPPTTSLSFGRDELVLVRAEAPQDMTSTTGLTGSRTERQTRRSYQVENRHKSSIDLQVLHATPVSRNEKSKSNHATNHNPAAWPGTSSKAPSPGSSPWPPGPPRSSAPSTPSATPRTLSCWSAHEQYRAAAPHGAFSAGPPRTLHCAGLWRGLSRKAPGTVGTLWAWLAFLVLQPWFATPLQMGL